jgi:hypothetical protein
MQYHFPHMQPLLILLFLATSQFIASSVGSSPIQGEVTIGAQNYVRILYAQAPFRLSYSVEVVNGPDGGFIDVYLVDDANLKKIMSGQYTQFEYIVQGSAIGVVSANITDLNIERDGQYSVVVLNRNLLFSLTVRYSASARESVIESIAPGIIIGIIIGCIGCCCVAVGLVFGTVHCVRKQRARRVLWVGEEMMTV